MSDWLHNLPVAWMALGVFGSTYLVAAAIQILVRFFADRGHARSFKAVSPGMLPPLGILFGLFVAFTAAQVWTDNEHAHTAVNREAGALKSVLAFGSALPAETEARLRALVRQHIEDSVNEEWPMMALRKASLSLSPLHLTEALQATLGLMPDSQAGQIAQGKIITALETAIEARQQRILVSRSQVNWVKWSCLFLMGTCALIGIAMVHSDDQLTSAIALALFATGVATSVLLIAAHDRPFVGDISVGPGPLLQVLPEAEGGRKKTDFSVPPRSSRG